MAKVLSKWVSIQNMNDEGDDDGYDVDVGESLSSSNVMWHSLSLFVFSYKVDGRWLKNSLYIICWI